METNSRTGRRSEAWPRTGTVSATNSIDIKGIHRMSIAAEPRTEVGDDRQPSGSRALWKRAPRVRRAQSHPALNRNYHHGPDSMYGARAGSGSRATLPPVGMKRKVRSTSARAEPPANAVCDDNSAGVLLKYTDASASQHVYK
ncbi:hypothetical protein EVAR_7012_1 [Eumeta japonica]|uniref:Uncharacterized protein n=1 Tax=Eumeta variegata TaxID=151549 RepID=A0A4C1THS2_EUMVA|nr:hypothetical protein EVAR_7012_1 [Eumeta japonica]